MKEKNIWLLRTDKTSNGYILGKCIKELSDVKIGQFVTTYYLMFDKEYFEPYNIYITSLEEIKEGDHVLSDSSIRALYLDGKINKASMLAEGQWKKVILTDNPKLITDGVQEISEDFLQWFIKNSTCEFVEVDRDEYYSKKAFIEGKDAITYEYKIIIPQEKLKQYPKTFKELFANTGIEPTTDKNGNTHYHFNAICKKEHKQEPLNLEKLEDKLDDALSKETKESLTDWLDSQRDKQEPNFYEKLKEYFETTPREKVLEDWNKSAHLDNVGPTIDAFLQNSAEERLMKIAHKILCDYGIKSIGEKIGILEVKKLMVKMANWQAERMYNEEDMLRFTEWISDNDWVYLPSKNYWVNEEEEESEKFFSTKELFGEWFQNYKK